MKTLGTTSSSSVGRRRSGEAVLSRPGARPGDPVRFRLPLPAPLSRTPSASALQRVRRRGRPGRWEASGAAGRGSDAGPLSSRSRGEGGWRASPEGRRSPGASRRGSPPSPDESEEDAVDPGEGCRARHCLDPVLARLIFPSTGEDWCLFGVDLVTTSHSSIEIVTSILFHSWDTVDGKTGS